MKKTIQENIRAKREREYREELTEREHALAKRKQSYRDYDAIPGYYPLDMNGDLEP